MNTGGFERRWRAARNRQSRIKSLHIQALEPDADLREITARMREVIRAYHEEAVGLTAADRSSPQRA